MLPFNSIARMSPLRLAMAAGGRVNFETGGLKYPDYGSTTTAPLKVTAPMPTEAERKAYFASHDAEGNLIIPNEFAPPNIPHDTVKAAPPHAYNLPNEYSIPRLGAAGIEALTTLGTGLASYIGGGAYGIGKNIASGKYGTPEGARIGEEAAAKVVQDYTYQPRLQAGQDMLEGMGSVMETFKVPPLGFPELSMLPGMRRRTPTDVQVMHGRTKAAAQGAKQYYGDPVTDYWNAQQGVRKEYPTLGASLKDMAYNLADTSARRQATRPSQQRTMADLAIPDTKFHAMRPSETVPILQVIDPKTKLHTTSGLGNTPGLSRAMKLQYYPELSSDVTVGRWSETLPVEKQESLQAFFNADAMTRFGNEGSLSQANQARRAAETDPDFGWRISKEWAALPENQGVALPTEYNERAAAANKAMTSMVGGYMKRYAGAADDPLLLEAAKTGNTTIRPYDLAQYDIPRAWIEKARENAGFPSSGTYLPQLEEAKQLREEVANLYANSESTLTQLQDEAQALRDSRTEAGLSNVGISIREQSPELADLMAKREAQERQLRGMDKAILKLEAANKQENLSDALLYPRSVGETRRLIPTLLNETDYPGITQMPDEQTVYDAREDTLPSSGILDLVKEHYGDEIMSGKIPLSQVGNWSLPKVAQKKFAADKIKRDADEREAVIGEQRVKVFSDELRDMGQDFGTATSIELKAGMPEDFILKATSKATKNLNICVNHGGKMEDGTYRPWYNIAKDMRDPLSYSEPANDTQKILSGKQTVSLLIDKDTSNVVGAIQYIKAGSKVDVGYVSGKKNFTPIDSKHRNALRDVLNAKAPMIGMTDSDPLSNNKVYDLMSSEGRKRAARDIGVPQKDIEDYLKVYPDTLRFQTVDDVRGMLGQDSTTPVVEDNVSALWDARNNIDLDRELIENPAGYEEARRTRHDLTIRVFQQVPSRENVRAPRPPNTAAIAAQARTMILSTGPVPEVASLLPVLVLENPSHFGVGNWSNAELDALDLQLRGALARRTPAGYDLVNTPDLPDDQVPRTFAAAQAIASSPRSSIGELNALIDELEEPIRSANMSRVRPTTAGWTNPMTPDELSDMWSNAHRALYHQLETTIEAALSNPNRSIERLQQLREHLRHPPGEGPLRHIEPDNLDEATSLIDDEIDNMQAAGGVFPAPSILPDAVLERLNDIENIPDNTLVNWLAQAERNAPSTMWNRLNEEQTREAVTAIEYEMGRRGLDGAQLGIEQVTEAPLQLFNDSPNAPAVIAPTSYENAFELLQQPGVSMEQINQILDIYGLNNPSTNEALFEAMDWDDADNLLAHSQEALLDRIYTVGNELMNNTTIPLHFSELLYEDLYQPPDTGPLRNITPDMPDSQRLDNFMNELLVSIAQRRHAGEGVPSARYPELNRMIDELRVRGEGAEFGWDFDPTRDRLHHDDEFMAYPSMIEPPPLNRIAAPLPIPPLNRIAAPLPPAILYELRDISTWTDSRLENVLGDVHRRDEQTVYRDLSEGMAAQVKALLQAEIDRRQNGMAQGGLVEHEQLFNDIIGVMHGTR